MTKNRLFALAMLLPTTMTLVAKDTKDGSAKEKRQQQPNVIIIFTDDQGYADFGFMGSTKTKTPVMDKLASEGTVFTDCYAQHVSGPSRAALLTGRHPLRNGARNLRADEVTIAEAIKSVGYQTACIGKWDVSERKETIEQMPNAQGFDYYYGALGANDSGKVQIHENNERARVITDMSQFTKLYTDKAIEFLENRDTQKPFLLYIAHTMLHSMVGASPEFLGKSDRGLYGDAVEELDFEVGRLMNSVEELGLRDNTLIIYTTDNGPWCQEGYQKRVEKRYNPGEIFWGDPGVLRDGKGSCYEGGSKVPCVMSMPGRIEQGVRKDGLISTLDFMPTLAKLCGFEMRSDVTIDGVDQSKMIFSKSGKSARETFCYMQVTNIGKVELSDLLAIRDSRWKLLLPNREPEKKHSFLADFGTNDYELYDLLNDPGETTNLVDKYPKIVERLKIKHAEMVSSLQSGK